jgi:hypothetical protein
MLRNDGRFIFFSQAIRSQTQAYALSFVGVIADYMTTQIGLARGFVETHPLYNSFYSLAIFWMACTILALTLPKERRWGQAILFISGWSFLGAINNLLVLSGIFGGLVI